MTKRGCAEVGGLGPCRQPARGINGSLVRHVRRYTEGQRAAHQVKDRRRRWRCSPSGHDRRPHRKRRRRPAGRRRTVSGPMLERGRGDVSRRVSADLASAAARAAAADSRHASRSMTRSRPTAATFGGAWFDAPTGVRARRRDDRRRRGAARRARARARPVASRRRCAAQLRRARAPGRRSCAAAQDPLGTAANGQVGIDVKTNRVVAAVPAAQRAALAARRRSRRRTLVADPGAVASPTPVHLA